MSKYVKKSLSRENCLDYLGVNISNEYNAFDWTATIFGNLNTLYRALTPGATTKIDNPGYLIKLFVGGWTVLGQMLSQAASSLAMLRQNSNAIKNRGVKISSGEKTDADKFNIYKDIFVNYKKVDTSDIEYYRDQFNLFKKAIEELKKNVCGPIPPRELVTSELSDLKLFRPGDIKSEMNNAVKYYEIKDKKFANLAGSIVKYVDEEIVQYLLNNITDKGGYIKTFK